MKSIVHRRKCNGERGVLSRLVVEAANRFMLVKETRSVVDEFLLPDHHCPYTKKFETPFEVVTISCLKNVLMDEVKQEGGSEPSSTTESSVREQGTTFTGEQKDGEITEERVQEEREKQLWRCRISHKTQPQRVLVGRLSSSPSGVLQLQQQGGSINLVSCNSKVRLCEKIGALVAIFEGDVVVEDFNIVQDGNMHSVQKRYLMVSDMTVLRKPESESNCRDESREFKYLVKILSKSPLVYSHLRTRADSIERLLQERFFMARVAVTKVARSGEEMERWQKFARFQGDLADLHPTLQEGDICELSIPSTIDAELVLKKTLSNACLKLLSKHFTSTECLHLPEKTVVRKVSSEKCRHDEIGVKNMLDGSSQTTGLLTVIGVVKMKCFMSPKFASEISQLDVDMCNSHDIGVPGSKVIRLLLMDQDEPGSSVWLYFPGVSYSFVNGYSLGIIPGALISATCVERKVAKMSRRVYLLGSVYTCVLPLSLCNRSLVQDQLTTLSHPIHYLSDPISNYSVFQSFACVARIMKVAMKAVCSFCDSEVVGGHCSYVGCQAPPSGKIAAYAEILVDDGTSTASVFMDTLSHVERLLKLSTFECSQLSLLVLTECQHLSFVTQKRAKDAEDGQGKQMQENNSNGGNADVIFQELCSRNELIRPMKLTCRKMKSGVTRKSDLVHLYCVDLADLRPSRDADELQKQVNIIA